ncbi:MAG: asparaginase domain-containing protein [Proteobacteria bacterium]|nr:asparaginase domain-containing protein [Pseudomonadota bacterium]
MIKIIVTGGTFDKIYDEKKGRLGFQQSHLKEALQRCKNQLEVSISILMLTDSKRLGDHHRDIIAEYVARCPEQKIVITHGTDTICQTGRHIGRKIKDKVVVLTGAMIPYSLKNSDALFNLGSALAFVQILPPEVYIAMNGMSFLASLCQKNKKTGCFEATTSIQKQDDDDQFLMSQSL